jgi:hypothetical protein
MNTLLKQSPPKRLPKTQKKRVDAVLGKYAHVHTSSIAFAAAKRSEAAREGKRR